MNMDPKMARLLAEREAAEVEGESLAEIFDRFDGLVGEFLEKMLGDADNHGADDEGA